MANITRWNPFREMVTMQSALDKFFDDAWQQWPELRQGDLRLALDVDDSDDHFVVTADLPGVEADNINVSVHDDLLTINAEIPEHTIEHEERKALIRERRYGRFSRSIRLPQPVNANEVQAEYRDGTLKLTLPKSEDAKVHVIPVRTGQDQGS
jgi:HSP20 family protein